MAAEIHPAALDVITISIGNTHASAKGWDRNGRSNETARFSSDFRSMLALASFALNAPDIVLASVVKQCSAKLINDLGAMQRKVLRFRSEIPAPIEIVPQPEDKVGDDRVAACLGALVHDPKSAWIVIDAGTAVTCNAVLPSAAGKRARFEGGLIYPGAAVSMRALNQSAAQLTNVNPSGAPAEFNFIGRNTEEAMRWGVLALQGCALPSIIDGQRAALKQDARVALTGGGAKCALLETMRQTGCERPMLHDPDLVHRGLFASWKAAREKKEAHGQAED